TKPTTVTAVHQQEQEPTTPGRITPAANGSGKTEEYGGGRASGPWFFIIIFVIALIVVIWRILRRPLGPPAPPDETPTKLTTASSSGGPTSTVAHSEERNGQKFPSYYPLRIAIELKGGGGKPPQQLDGWQA